MKFNKLIEYLLEQNIVDVVDDNWFVKLPTNSPQMANSIFQGAHIDWQMRNAGYSDEDIKKYFDLRRQNMSHEDALKQIPPPKPKGINYQDPEVQRKIKQAFRDKGYTEEELIGIDSLFAPERVSSLLTSMLANGIDINQVLSSK